MGKGYNNFMSKKAFHPGSYANQKRVHEAEAKAEAKRKHDEETLAQYQKEQELFNQKSLISKQSKDKLSLNFMYEAPPGFEKPEAKQGDRVEWLSASGRPEPSTSRKTPAGTLKTNKEAADDDHDDGPPIVLEWKRERPARRPRKEPLSNAPSSSQAPQPLAPIECKSKIKRELKFQDASASIKQEPADFKSNYNPLNLKEDLHHDDTRKRMKKGP